MITRWQLLVASTMVHCFCVFGGDPPIKQTLPLRTNSPAARLSTNVVPHGELALTGVIELSPVKRAFIERQSSGSVCELYSLAQGQTLGGIELIEVRAAEGKAKVRYRGSVVELSLVTSAAVAAEPEKARDQSHTVYHTRRAKLERERDARTD